LQEITIETSASNKIYNHSRTNMMFSPLRMLRTIRQKLRYQRESTGILHLLDRAHNLYIQLHALYNRCALIGIGVLHTWCITFEDVSNRSCFRHAVQNDTRQGLLHL